MGHREVHVESTAYFRLEVQDSRFCSIQRGRVFVFRKSRTEKDQMLLEQIKNRARNESKRGCGKKFKQFGSQHRNRLQ